MADKFSGCEIAEIGVQIEKNGMEFYSELAKMTDNPKAKEVFGYLAEAETRHMEVFRKVHGTFCAYDPGGAYTDEYFAYLNAIAGQYVFTQKDRGVETARSVKNYQDGIDLGISLEKDSILFYLMVREMVPENERALVDAVISEEKKHLVDLCDLKGGCNG